MNIKKVHVYPNVTWSTLIKNHKYDIAILELEKEVQLTAKVKSFFHLTTPSLTSGASNMSPKQQVLLQGDCDGLLPMFQVEPTYSGEKVVITGWGKVNQVRRVKAMIA